MVLDNRRRLLNVSQIFLANLLNDLIVVVDVFLEVLGSVDRNSVHVVRSYLCLARIFDRYTKKHFNFFQIVLPTNNLKVIYKNLNT